MKGTMDLGEQRTQSHAAARSQLLGKVAIVTGAGRGIGEAIARAFARQCANLVLAARTTSDLEKVATDVERLGSKAIVAAGDVSKQKEVDEIVSATLDEYGRVDVLVNAAAIHGPIGCLWEADAERWIDAVRVNLLGTFLCCRAVIPHLIASRGGRSSTSPVEALPRLRLA